MFKLSQKPENRKVGARNTRQQNKYTFKTDNKVGTKYANSPYYKGTKLWNSLDVDVQFSDIYMFKTKIDCTYKTYVKDFIV